MICIKNNLLIDRKIVLKKLYACICLLLLLPACGNKEPEKEKEFVFEGEATITVQPVAFLDSSTRIAIENYSASHPNVTFEILDPIEWSTRDIGLARVYADITNGTGPDIIIAEREDLSCS